MPTQLMKLQHFCCKPLTLPFAQHIIEKLNIFTCSHSALQTLPLYMRPLSSNADGSFSLTSFPGITVRN
jgi:hypothetical protein